MKLVFLCLLFSLLSVSANQELIYQGTVIAKDGDNLQKLIEREFGLEFVLARVEWSAWREKIRELNPKSNLSYLIENEKIKIEVPKKKLDEEKTKKLSAVEFFDPEVNNEDFISFNTENNQATRFLATDLNSTTEYDHLFSKTDIEPDAIPEIKQSLGIFYMGSRGSFDETTTSGSALSSEQNSNLSFGINYGRTKQHSTYSGSLYLSLLSTEDNTNGNDTSTVSIPPEWGGNFYYRNKRNPYFAPLFYGIDLENFSTFNTDEFFQGETVTTRQHMILYATFGYDYWAKVSSGELLFKASLARSFYTSSSRESTLSSEQFSGWRIMTYVNYQPKGKLFYHFMYKRHLLEGPTELTIQRIGLGFGYSFF